MAKQAGNIFIEGSIDDLIFYKMEGRYYVGRKSSLTAKKFRRSKAFERSRESCRRFAEGNRLASKIYRMVDVERKAYSLFCFLKKRVILLLKEGNSIGEANEILIDYLLSFELLTRGGVQKPKKEKEFRLKTSTKKIHNQINDLFPNPVPAATKNIKDLAAEKKGGGRRWRHIFQRSKSCGLKNDFILAKSANSATSLSF